MPDNELSFEGFLNEVDPLYQNFAREMDTFLISNGCKQKLQLAKNGYVVSYTHTKSKRVIINFVFRKSGLLIRMYGDYVNQYENLLETMPEKMLKSIDKAPVCKRLIDPLTCNQKCAMGYDFTVSGKQYKKCRYNCFMFEVNNESIPFIKAFVENEIKERAG